MQGMKLILHNNIEKCVFKMCNSPQTQQGESWHLSQLVCLLMACVCSLPRDVSSHSELSTAACESHYCSVVSVESFAS